MQQQSYFGEQGYLQALADILDTAQPRGTRNDGGTLATFGGKFIYDMNEGIPLFTTKRLFTSGIVGELLWFLRGETNVKLLHEWGIHIWDEWADSSGNLGSVYGAQWRAWAGQDGELIDQIANLLSGLEAEPHGRRHVVSAWNVSDLEDMALPPCHMFYQFFVEDDGRLSLQMYQRSADMFLGVPFNVASYSILLHIVAAVLGREPAYFIHLTGDTHIYANHVEQVKAQIAREPRPLPKLLIHKNLRGFGVGGLETLEISDFSFKDYNPHPAIKAEVSR
jgi:thymidylate synthase